MAADTPKMGLHTWNQPLDPYDFEQLTNNWNIVDYHDHSPGRGVQIPMGGIAAGAVGVAQLASNVPVVPTGGIILWPMASPTPVGYLYCNGTQYASAAYPALFAVIGTHFSTSPPAGNFNVPNLNTFASATATGVASGTIYYWIKT
jgi:hypothetical protein